MIKAVVKNALIGLACLASGLGAAPASAEVAAGAFVLTCCRGSAEDVQAALAQGARVNLIPEGEPSPLAAAIICPGDKSAKVKVLLAAGADPNLLPGDINELRLAVGQGDLEIVRELLTAGARVETGRPRPILVEAAMNSFTWQPADHAELLHLLLDKGARIDEALADGTTALLGAAIHGGPEAVEVLIAAGAKEQINQPNQFGLTPLMLAARNNFQAGTVATLLKHGADPGLKDQNGLSALDHAQSNQTPAADEINRLLAPAQNRGQSEKKS